MQSFDVGNVTFGDGGLSFILGPCVVESAQHAMFMAQEINDICKHVGVGFVYKSSFDKANRSSIESFRGQGMDFGLEVLAVQPILPCRFHEGSEQRMSAERFRFVFRMKLACDKVRMRFPRELDHLYKLSIGRHAAEYEPFFLEYVSELRVEFITMTVALTDLLSTVIDIACE